MKEIIYATDCSSHSAAALNFAIGFAKQMGAICHLAHIYTIPPVENTTLRSMKQIRERAQEEHLDMLVKYVKSNTSSDVDTEHIRFVALENTSVSNALFSLATEVGADLIILGKKDEHSLRGVFAGNIANNLLARLSCPLLVVPNAIEQTELKNLVYATDFEADDILALTCIQKVVEVFGSSVKVVHVPMEGEYASSEQMEWFKEMLLQKSSMPEIEFHMVLADSVSKGIQVFLQESKAQLLCMLEREEKGFFERLLHKDQVKQMKAMSTIPLMCFNRKCFA